MTRKLTLGGKAPQIGNKVSHSNRKTKHAWLPNIQKRSLFSLVLGKSYRMTLPAETIRSVDKIGGLDNYLLKISPDLLNEPMRRLQSIIQAQTVKQADTASIN